MLIRIVAIVIITIISAKPAEGHHGFTGRYDRSKPLYIEGQITQAAYMLPHGLITIEPSRPTPPPPDLSNGRRAGCRSMSALNVARRVS